MDPADQANGQVWKPRPMKNQDAHNAAQIIDIFLPGQIAALQILVNVAMIFLAWYAVTVEVFFRYRFGERYFNLVKIGVATIIMFGVIQIGRFLIPASNITGQIVNYLLLQVLWLAFLLAAGFHYVDIYLRTKRGEVWHTQSFGLSQLYRIPALQRFNDWQMYRFVEPGICFLLGFILFFINGPIGVWLIVASIALFLRNNIAYNQQRETLLDMMDERIQSQVLAAALQGASKKESLGFSVAEVPQLLKHDLLSVARAAAASPPDFTAQVAERLRATRPNLAAVAEAVEEGEAIEDSTAVENGQPDFTAQVAERLRPAQPTPSVEGVTLENPLKYVQPDLTDTDRDRAI